jgi:hypothetical protein
MTIKILGEKNLEIPREHGGFGMPKIILGEKTQKFHIHTSGDLCGARDSMIARVWPSTPVANATKPRAM